MLGDRVRAEPHTKAQIPWLERLGRTWPGLTVQLLSLDPCSGPHARFQPRPVRPVFCPPEAALGSVCMRAERASGLTVPNMSASHTAPFLAPPSLLSLVIRR